jgi:hypothetical protein
MAAESTQLTTDGRTMPAGPSPNLGVDETGVLLMKDATAILQGKMNKRHRSFGPFG